MIVLSAAALALAACATPGETVRNYKGLSAKTLAQRLGPPTSERVVMGDKVYRWETGNPRGYYCNLDATVDGANIVRSVSVNGNNGGCLQMDDMLR